MGFERGVYFLANDRMRGEAVAFLNSFRRFNPTLPLCLIPYDNACRSVLKLGVRHGFTVYEDKGYLKYCDGTGSLFCHDPKKVGTFRKLAIWNGPFENFIYLDADTVVFKDLNFLFELLEEFDYLSASCGDRPMVWRDSVYDSGELTPEQIRYSCNTGFILSHRQMFSPDGVRLAIASARGMKKYMTTATHEQPFFNYLIARSGKRYGSIYEKLPHIGNEWAGIPTHQIREDGTMTDAEGRELLFLHWAGFEGHATTGFSKLKRTIRSLFGAKRRRPAPFPYWEVWEYYRYLKRPLQQVCLHASEAGP